MKREECCGRCKWHWKDDSNDEWYCAKWGCEWEYEYTPYDHECDEYEERD